MDPKVCFTWMMAAAREGELAEAREHAENLISWLDREGFAPMLRITADDSVSFLVTDQLAEAFCRAACEHVLKPPTPRQPMHGDLDELAP